MSLILIIGLMVKNNHKKTITAVFWQSVWYHAAIASKGAASYYLSLVPLVKDTEAIKMKTWEEKLSHGSQNWLPPKKSSQTITNNHRLFCDDFL